MNKTSMWLQSFNSEKKLSDHNHEKYVQKLQGKTIAVTGGKGGVGKTSITLKMAKDLSAQGQKVLIIDCDSNLGNTSIKLGLPLTNMFYDLVSGSKSFDQCLYKDGNLHLLSACNGSLDLFNEQLKIEQIVTDIISCHKKDYDFIFLDCPAGISKEIMTINAYCDHRILIVTPDKSSITDSYSQIKILNNFFSIDLTSLKKFSPS